MKLALAMLSAITSLALADEVLVSAPELYGQRGIITQTIGFGRWISTDKVKVTTNGSTVLIEEIGDVQAASTNITGELYGDEQLLIPATVNVTVSTNVVNGDNSSGCNMCFDNYGNERHPGFTPAVMNHVPCAKYHPATERWTITNVVKKVTLTVEWNGKPLTHTGETTLSSTTNRWKLASEWKKD